LLCGALALIGASACGDDDGGGVDDLGIESSGGVPDCFPDDAPIPDGDVQGGISLDQGENTICTFTVRTDAGVNDAIESYKSALEDDGWELAYEMPGEEGASLGVTKGDDGISAGGTVLEDMTVLTVSASAAESVAGVAPPTTAAG